MLNFKLKYAFLITYEFTMFLKQEKREDGMVLFCSCPIARGALPSDNSASLRQSILFIQGSVRGSKDSWHAPNEMKPNRLRDDTSGPTMGCHPRWR